MRNDRDRLPAGSACLALRLSLRLCEHRTSNIEHRSTSRSTSWLVRLDSETLDVHVDVAIFLQAAGRAYFAAAVCPLLPRVCKPGAYQMSLV